MAPIIPPLIPRPTFSDLTALATKQFFAGDESAARNFCRALQDAGLIGRGQRGRLLRLVSKTTCDRGGKLREPTQLFSCT